MIICFFDFEIISDWRFQNQNNRRSPLADLLRKCNFFDNLCVSSIYLELNLLIAGKKFTKDRRDVTLETKMMVI